MSSTERSANRRARERAARERAESARNSTLTVLAEEVSPQTPLPESTQLSDQKEAENRPESGSGGSGSPEIRSVSTPAREVVSTHGNAQRAVLVAPYQSDDERPIPPRLFERAQELGVFSDLLSGMPSVALESVEDSAREFVSYWTIGAGAMKGRRQWMLRLREHVRKSWREGRLNAPGAIEHAARSGRSAREAEEPARKFPDPWAWQWEPGGPNFGKPRPTTGPEADPNLNSRTRREK